VSDNGERCLRDHLKCCGVVSLVQRRPMDRAGGGERGEKGDDEELVHCEADLEGGVETVCGASEGLSRIGYLKFCEEDEDEDGQHAAGEKD
jgi:hypothetical protein